MSNSWKRTVLGLLAPLRVGFAGLGRKPGGETVLSMLLDETDLASTGITMTTEHTYRTFATFESTVELDRARKDGSITAVRALRNANVMRSLRISVAPFVSASDAESSVLRAVDNVRFKGRRTPSTDRYLEDMSVPGVSHVLVREIIGDGPRGPGGDRLLAGAVDNYLLRLTFQAQGRIDEQWPWEEITSIATQQALKIRKILNT
jgi:hypothetical protein